MTLKNDLNALIEFNKRNIIKLNIFAEDRIVEEEPETAATTLRYEATKKNYVIDINGNSYSLNVNRSKSTENYAAMEDEMVYDTTVKNDSLMISFRPLYVEKDLNRDNPILIERYEHDFLKGENGIPDNLLDFIQEVESTRKRIRMDQWEHAQYDDPAVYYTVEGEDNVVRKNFIPNVVYKEPVFDKMNLDINGSETKYNQENPSMLKDFLKDSVDRDKMRFKNKMEKDYKLPSLFKDKKNEGVNFLNVAELNDLANKSGTPSLLLNKLSRYNSEALQEMVFAFKSSDEFLKKFTAPPKEPEKEKTYQYKNKW